jgi:2-succinyl-5-enolpyruvyl-6-hydroxy-3-cyclohexene-1-carboxylate synthase
MSSDLHSAWARLFVASLASAGVRHAVLSPGSRSTPLALALASEPRITTVVVIDERAAGFVALGISRATATPAVLVCTSGTAGAHYYPAVIEAAESEIPLVVVTADRPWELQRCGASQTIDQTRLFGAFVRHAATLGEPAPHLEALRAVPRTAAAVVRLARGPWPGPVHVDVAFRKPLEPIAIAGREAWQGDLDALVERGVPDATHGVPRAGDDAVAALVARVAASKSVWLVAGPTRAVERAAMRDAVAAFARAASATVLAEPTSAARFGAGELIHPVDATLASDSFMASAAPDLIIEVGAPPVSASWLRIAMRGTIDRVVIGAPRLADPAGTATLVLEGDAADVLSRAARALAERADREASAREASKTRAASLGAAIDRVVSRALDAAPFSEASIARSLVDALPGGAVLLVGNSGIVRELDAWGGRGRDAFDVHHQRGAAGIDGLVAGAFGARVATDPARPVVVLLGDVAAVHDLGALVVARDAKAPLVVVVVDNGGGRIFEQLPLGDARVEPAVIERSFVTPHGVSITAVAAALGLATSRVDASRDFRAALEAALVLPATTVIEAVVAPRDAAARTRALRQAIDRAVAEATR